MRAAIAIAAVVAGLFSLPGARADEIQDAVTNVTETKAHPFVIVEFDLKQADGRGGREVKLQGTIVSEDGLVLVSGSKLVEPPVGDSYAKPTEFSVRFPGDEKLEAEFVGKDDELNLALLRILPEEGEEATKYEPVPFAEDVNIIPAEQLIAVRRLGKVDDDLLTFGVFRVTNVIPRPGLPTEYRVTGNLGSFQSCPIWAFRDDNELHLVGFVASSSLTRGRGGYRFVDGRLERVPSGGGSPGHPLRILDAQTIQEFLAEPTRFTRRDCWLGVTGLQALTKDLAEALGIENPGGLVVGRVGEESPAEKAGMKAEDVIVAVDGEALDTVEDQDIASFAKSMRRAKAGDVRTIKVLRRKGEEHVEVELAVTLDEAPLSENEVSEYHDIAFGLKLKPLTRDFLERGHLSLDLVGVRVTSVESASWAYIAGIRTGDVIQKMVLKRCDDLDAYKEIMASLHETRDSEVCYNVLRSRKSLFLCVRPDWNLVEALK